MESFVKYIIPAMSNYDIINYPNLFNFLYSIFIKLDDKCKKDFMVQMKLLMGSKFIECFKNYLFRKVPSQELFNFFD